MPARDAAPGLQGELGRIAAVGYGLLVVAAALLSVPEGPLTALHWLAGAVICWTFVLWQCFQRLHLNFSPNSDGNATGHYGNLGDGNRVTLLRGLLIAGTAGFLAPGPGGISPWLMYVPAALYTAAVLGDLLDGVMARRQEQTTRLGTELDTALDALGLLIAPLLGVMHGKLHVSYLLVGIAFYLFRGGMHWRKRHARPVYQLPPSRLRRQLAGLQMALVATALWPPIPGSVTSGLGIALMLPLLLGFCRDWLHVTGRAGGYRAPAS